MELQGDPVLVRVPGAVEADVDGERIVMSPADFGYFSLAGAAASVWERIDGVARLSAIVAGLESEFSAEPGVIRAETEAFVRALVAAGLVEGR